MTHQKEYFILDQKRKVELVGRIRKSITNFDQKQMILDLHLFDFRLGL